MSESDNRKAVEDNSDNGKEPFNTKGSCMDNSICMEPRMTDKYMGMEDFSMRVEKPSVLLHSCCGPCSTAVVERLAPDYQITIYFYNPCITDEEEYQKTREFFARVKAFMECDLKMKV